MATDGGAGIVLVSDRWLRENRGTVGGPVARIAGWGHRNASLHLRDKLDASADADYVFPHVRDAISDAISRAGIDDVFALDGIETHDCFTISQYMAIDHFGITKPGCSGDAIDSGITERDGQLPINPSGGLIGGGHPVGATGVRMLLDSYLQVTGQATGYQVEGARRFATLNVGGSTATVVCTVIEAAWPCRDPLSGARHLQTYNSPSGSGSGVVKPGRCCRTRRPSNFDGDIRDCLLGETIGELTLLIDRPTTQLAEGLRAGH